MTEKDIINIINSKFELKFHDDYIIKAIGDDSAVIKYDSENYLLLSTDSMVENVHYDPIYTPWKHFAFKLLTRGVSDIYAMNGIPMFFLFSFSISNRYNSDILNEIIIGLKYAADYYRVDLIGGDISTSQKGGIFTVTVVGKSNKNKIVYRNGAKVGDLICVTGDLGAPFAGFKILEREKLTFLEDPNIQPDLNEFPYVIERFLRPVARKDIVEYFYIEEVVPSSMMDISDGLAIDLHNLYESNRSNKGFIIFLEKIPIDPETIRVADSFEEDPINYALYGGDEYQLLMTLRQDEFELLKKNKDISIIGYVTDKVEGVYFQDIDNTLHELPRIGWDHIEKIIKETYGDENSK